MGSTYCYNSSNYKTVVDSQSNGVNTWVNVLNRTNLDFEVMHERNAHNFPLDLAAAESATVAFVAPSEQNSAP